MLTHSTQTVKNIYYYLS